MQEAEHGVVPQVISVIEIGDAHADLGGEWKRWGDLKRDPGHGNARVEDERGVAQRKLFGWYHKLAIIDVIHFDVDGLFGSHPYAIDRDASRQGK